MVFFQLNVTGLLFQSFRTASPELIDTEGLVQDRPTQPAY